MFCTQCGAPLRGDASFCGNCGWTVPSSQTLRAEVEAREARDLKLCVKCRSEIPIDADICHRCDAPQPGYDQFAAATFPSEITVREPVPIPSVPVQNVFELATIGRRVGAYLIDIVVLVII